MRGDRRSSSFHKDKPAGLSRALSWLSVSTLSRQSRRMFHSQSELHAVHKGHTYSHSHTHLHAADGDEDDDDNWVYQPQHKIGKARSGSLSFYGPLFSISMFLTLPGARGGMRRQWDHLEAGSDASGRSGARE
ncbi:putative NHS-like protein 1-like [Scophthalmus maximus]|uniref:Putative NHS-like protein 1-like n=1 Tax=Scophthalmus maximus TaxID=52904 RepID=A0A2U9CVW7_SCOMX|nr:putative NHS-like protein 1-like [Scophthalmus maximus]